jgi:hypothetical protein
MTRRREIAETSKTCTGGDVWCRKETDGLDRRMQVTLRSIERTARADRSKVRTKRRSKKVATPMPFTAAAM